MRNGKVTQVHTRLLRGYRPRSFADLKEMGVDVVINLQSGFFEQFTNSLYERESAADFGMEEISFPLSNWSSPNEEQIRGLIRAIELRRAANKTVYVHCKWGRDRTGYVIAAWEMVVKKRSYEQALANLHAGGFRRRVYSHWIKTLKRFERDLA